MKRSVLIISLLFEYAIIFSAPIPVQKKITPTQKLEYYDQVIINDTDFPVKISLLDEEDFFYEEYVLEPNDIHILKEKLFVEPTTSKKLLIQTSYIYIASIRYVTPNEAVYLLKSIKKNPNTKHETQDGWKTFEEDGEEIFVLETPSYPTISSETDFNTNSIETPEKVQIMFNSIIETLRLENNSVSSSVSTDVPNNFDDLEEEL